MERDLKRTGKELRERWAQKMPRFFRQLVVLCSCVIAIAAAINSGVPALGGTLHDWWTDIYTYVIGGCIGIIVTCKLTVAGGYKDIDPDKVIRCGEIVDSDSEAPNMSDVETEQPFSSPHETESYNDGTNA